MMLRGSVAVRVFWVGETCSAVGARCAVTTTSLSAGARLRSSSDLLPVTSALGSGGWASTTPGSAHEASRARGSALRRKRPGALKSGRRTSAVQV